MNPNMTPLPPGYTHVQHTFEPVFDEHSRILILGSFPSVKSRENQFYYGHPQNRFWKLMAQLLEVPVPQSIDEKKTMLLTHGLALWDVITSWRHRIPALQTLLRTGYRASGCALSFHQSRKRGFFPGTAVRMLE